MNKGWLPVVVALLGLVVPLCAEPASAVTSYTGMSPYATPCYRDARDVFGPYWLLDDTGRHGNDARVHLMYSPSCRHVWATIDHAYGADANQAGCEVTIYRNSDGGRFTAHVRLGATSAYTRIMNDAGVTSHASAWCDTSAGWQFSRRTPPY